MHSLPTAHSGSSDGSVCARSRCLHKVSFKKHAVTGSDPTHGVIPHLVISLWQVRTTHAVAMLFMNTHIHKYTYDHSPDSSHSHDTHKLGAKDRVCVAKIFPGFKTIKLTGDEWLLRNLSCCFMGPPGSPPKQLFNSTFMSLLGLSTD